MIFKNFIILILFLPFSCVLANDEMIIGRWSGSYDPNKKQLIKVEFDNKKNYSLKLDGKIYKGKFERYFLAPPEYRVKNTFMLKLKDQNNQHIYNLSIFFENDIMKVEILSPKGDDTSGTYSCKKLKKN